MTRGKPSLAALAFAAAPWIGASWAFGQQAPPELAQLPWALATCSALFVIGASGRSSARTQRSLVGAAVLCTVGLALPGLTDSPGLTLVTLLGLAALLSRFDGGREMLGELERATHWFAATSMAQRASAACLGLWLFALASGRPTPVSLVAIGWASAVALYAIVAWLVRHRRDVLLALPLAFSVLLGLVAAWFSRDSAWSALSAAAVIPSLSALALARAPSESGLDPWRALFDDPARLPATTFLVLILVGSALLALPFAGAHGVSVSGIDAVFTAVSAVCVTGLTSVDTSKAWSPLGQALILLLIQVGGLGIMSLSALTLGALGRRLSLRHESALAGMLSADDSSQLYGTARHLILYTFTIEGLGAAALTLAGVQRGDALGQALWEGVFTAVSAFCNAGFGLRTDNLVGFNTEPWTLHVVGWLIIFGGISPAVVLGLPGLFQRARPVPVQHRLVVGTTLVLLLLGTALYLGLEWNHSLAGLGLWDRLHNAWFQSVTLRTAGFNSVDLTTTHPATFFVMVSWMFIGGSPGGTAGGIKTTTLCVLMLAVSAAMRGYPTARVLGRSVPHRTVYRAAAVATIGAGFGMMALIALLATQHMPGDLALFEVVSALGTVGLSLGGTALLDEVGKLIIMICMFAGRIGPLTLFMVLNSRDQTFAWKYPETEIDLG
jgi:trk system potassium uptake protein TrkH